MGYLDAQPLEFTDFSEGLTDNFLQGDPKRYAKADNFLITVDKKLEVRPGTLVYDSAAYVLPTAGSRVSGLFTTINESILFAHAGRALYTQSPDSRAGTAWTSITGPTGNEPVGGGGSYDQLTTGEFQRQTYFTSSGGGLPGHVFRDQTNTWKAVTAGVPRTLWTPNYPTDGSLLTVCLRQANALRASMVSHFNDAGDTTKQHLVIDKWSLSYFATQTWTIVVDAEYPGPQPAPTPAPAATDQASLFTLCVALALAYEHHRNDLAGGTPSTAGATGNKFYHQSILVQPFGGTGTFPSGLGINTQLATSGVVTTLTKTAAFLDELAQKWYWHQLSPLSHSATNNYALMSKYLITTPKVGTIYSSQFQMQVTPNYGDFLAYGTWIKSVHNKHIMNTGAGYLSGAAGFGNHGQSYAPYSITLPDPSDFDSAALTIFWARFLYGSLHVFDSNVATHSSGTFTGVAGSTSISSVSFAVGNTLTPGQWLVCGTAIFTNVDGASTKAAQVLSSGAGTAVLSLPVTLSASGIKGQVSASWFHVVSDGVGGGTFGVDTTTNAAGLSEFLSTSTGAIGADLISWVSLGTEYLYALGAHELNGVSHFTANVLSTDLGGTSSQNGNPFYIPPVVTYAWASFYRYQYVVELGGLLYIDEGNPIFSTSIQTFPSYPVGTQIASANAAYFNAVSIAQQNSSASIAGIPPLANTPLTNYDTLISVAPTPTDGSTGSYNNLTVELYRTSNGGTTFYTLDSLTNGTVSYSDTTNELFPLPGTTALNLRETMYTSGGVVGNDPPPDAHYVHAFGGFMYYGAVTDTGQYFANRVRQSIQFEPDSAPATFSDDLEDELTGLSSTKANLIGLCRNTIYRFSGSFTSTGQGGLTHDRVGDEIGCLSAKSAVKTEVGLFFAGTDGFYFTDGYQLIKISLDLDKTYAALTASSIQRKRIYGAYDKLTRRIWWCMQSNPTAADCDVIFVYYLNYGVKPSGVFTKILTTQSWQPACAVLYKRQMIIGDSRGYLFKTDPDTKTDPLINTATTQDQWQQTYIPWAFRTCALDFGTTYKRKWCTRVHCVGQNVGNASIQINSINDAGTAPDGSSSSLPLAPLQYTRNFTWGDPNFVWGSTSCAWKYDGVMDAWRRFPSKSLRSDFKQVEYVPGNFVLYRSDSYPPFCFATVNAGATTAVIQTPAGFTTIIWPKDVVNYSISFDSDQYATQYLITALSGDFKTITFADPSATALSNSGAKWQISGIRKQNRIRITSFLVKFALLGETTEAYPGNSSADGGGGNA